MNEDTGSRPLRALALLVLVTGTSWELLGRTRSLRHPAGATFDDLLTAGAGWALLAGLGWVLLICTAASLEALTWGRLEVTARVCPTRVRDLLLPVLGLALATGATTPSWAASGPTNPTSGGAKAAARTLPVPVRPVDERGPMAVVRPGDTLWGLARERLGSSATDAEVARVVARTHRLNRALLGPDPDLIRPGQQLTLPHLPAHPVADLPAAHHEEKR